MKNKHEEIDQWVFSEELKSRFTLAQTQHINQPKGFIIDFDIDLTADAPRRIDWRG
jgi:hypothetical protein